ncbi:uncharacterized protein FOMMEDRAFT_148802 [Fomitiporia mediterranea MF3/22]|uniref:uncharacterized protein n=1 Tax=Fomitiporia mediterranea (strain MF3/22) TaxID=694068 RepID=UPI00044099E7|nr:uncharacterized protein FOMMEDRAFT_148802 [Fomitiporia mediterranea MF3/22]EJC99292.1 hypothetical protein FOMMEDRAFT_148802 [Fomitiporia mediterranea MF3/22]
MVSDTDPYHEVQREMQGTLANAGTLLSSFRRIQSIGQAKSNGRGEESEELSYARSELKATLSTLEADLEDLEESVRVVENSGPKSFGLDDSEVQRRRRYVREVRQELDSMRAEVASSEVGSKHFAYRLGWLTQEEQRLGSSGTPRYAPSSPTSRPKATFSDPLQQPRDNEEDDQAAWSRMEQQMIMQEQDKTIDSITGTVVTLTEQAGLMGTELREHNELLGDLEHNVDHTETKLNKSLRRLQRFVRETEETKSGWCIAILIVILCIEGRFSNSMGIYLLYTM